MNRTSIRQPLWLVLALLASFLPAGCLFGGHKQVAQAPAAAAAAPDQILYDRAVNDFQHGRYTESRLSLQALINTYPDSEYLAKAKLAVADSYYKEGGIEGLMQAVQEYEDFQTFFPFLPEASYAQMQIGMAHYRMMEKADRDPTQARLAEQSFQTFLLKYPKSELVPQAEQRLRDVQEVLAEGEFDIAQFYYVKGDYRAAGARLVEVTNRYPLFSRADEAIWMMGDIYRRAARGAKNEEVRARWLTLSDAELARLLKDYPLSPLAKQAKNLLAQDGVKPPVPDPKVLALAKEQQKLSRRRGKESLFDRAEGMLKSSPDVSRAALVGEPDLNPPGESDTEQEDIQTAADAGGTGSSVGQNLNVQAVAQGAGASSSSSSSSSSTSTSSSSSSAVDPATGSGTAVTSSADGSGAANPPAATSVPPPDSGAPPPASTAASSSQDTSQADASKSDSTKLNKKKESTSKKKKGLRKLIPW